MLASLTWIIQKLRTPAKPQRFFPLSTEDNTPSPTDAATTPAATAVIVPLDIYEAFDKQRQEMDCGTLEQLLAVEALLRHQWTEGRRFEDLKDLFEKCFPLSEPFVGNGHQATPAVLLMVLKGVVYDATQFVEQHPGGPHILRMNAGQESWETFEPMHSEDTVQNLLPTLRVGTMVGRVEDLIGEQVPVPSALLQLPTAPPAAAKAPAAAAAKAVKQPPKTYRVKSITMLTKASDKVQNPTASICFEGSVQIPPGGHMRVHCPAERNPRTNKATTRSYTPYETTADTFTISVKKYEGGVVSGYLHSLQAGDEILLSGPDAPHVPLRPSDVTGDILLIAGGTGIAPIYSIAKYILEETKHSVAIFACFRNADDALLVEQLEALMEQYGEHHVFSQRDREVRCEVHIAFSRLDETAVKQFLEERQQLTPPSSPMRGHVGRLDVPHVDLSSVAQRATVAYLCGPPSFAQGVEAVLRASNKTAKRLYPQQEGGPRVFPL